MKPAHFHPPAPAEQNEVTMKSFFHGRVRIASVLLVGVLPLLLAGCGGKKGTSGAAIKFLSMDYDPASTAVQKQIVEDFNRQNPDGKVSIEVVNWNDGHQKLQTLISGGQAPDVAIVGTRWLLEYSDAGLLEDLSDMDQHGLKTSDFLPGPLDQGRVDGTLLGLPTAVSVRGLYYNKAMLDKAGLKPPKTWAELRDAAKKVQAANPGVAGFGVQGKEVETDLYYYYFLWGAGGEILDESGKCALDSPAGMEALNFELGLVNDGLSEKEPTGYNREGLQDLFKAKKIAMLITGPWFAGMLKKDNAALKFGVTLPPGKTAPIAPAAADEIVMFKSTKNADLAKKFLAFWFQDKNRIAWDKASGMLPEKKTVAASPEMQADPDRKFFMAALPEGRFVPLNPHWEQMANAVSNAVQSALLGQASPKAALEKACADVQEIQDQAAQ
jgi:multiple sugar transport system substrate-binding protein